MKRLFVLLPLLLLETVSSQSKNELRFSERVSQARLQQTVRELVAFGNRQGGTPSGDRAAAYLQKQFKSLGLKTELLVETEKLTFTNIASYLEIVRPSTLKGVFSGAWLAGFSPSVKSRRARLLPVRESDDLDEMKVDSAAVLVRADQVDRLYPRLAAKGAVCVLAWAEPNSKAYLDCAMVTSLPESANNPIPLFDISRRTAHTLIKKLASKQEVTITFSTKTRIVKGKAKTVVATLPGRSRKYIIVCAHGDSDSGGPGADDNASGVAGVLEVARVLTSLRQEKKLPVPDSSVRFIIWGSEYASSGSYVKNRGSELDQIVAVLNFDEIGTGATRDCIYFEGNDQKVNRELLRTMQAVGEDYAGSDGFWDEATTNSSQGGTDSYVFQSNYLSRLGVAPLEIPSVTIYTAAWEEPRTLYQPREWRSKAWQGPADSVYVDYSLYYHSSLDVPSMTTDREPFDMVWGAKAVGLTLLRILWH